MLVWYLIVSELNPGYNGIGDGYDARAPQDSRFNLIDWMEPVYFGRTKMSHFTMELWLQVIG